MRMSLLQGTIKARIEAGIHRPVYVMGPPGGGKTQGAKQIAAELDIGFVPFHAPTLQIEDISMPVISAKRDAVNFIVDKAFPMEGTNHPDSGILLIDELPQADASVQKMLANLLQEREIKGKKLKDGWTIIATGNRQSDRAGANRVLSHLMNRMTAIELEPHLDDWCNWYMAQDNFSFEGLSFLRFKPNLLLDFNAQRDINPTPRAWVEGVFATLGTIPHEAEMEAWRGDVGEGPAAEFTSYLRIYRSLPNPDAVLLNPDSHVVPTEGATLYALSGALAQRATRDNFDRVMAYSKRMPPEFTVLLVKDAMKLCPAVSSTQAFVKWAQKEGAALLT